MIHARLSRVLSTTALFAALTACSTMEHAYDSVSNAFGSDEKPSRGKVELRSPAAAPVQDVKTGDIQDTAQPVELGRVSDPELSGQPSHHAMAEAPQKIVPSPIMTPEAQAVAAPAVATPATVPATNNTLALLTIRFNQPRVVYEDALAQAVDMAEKTKSGVIYEVLSSVPDLTSLPPDAQEKLSARAKDNLRNVVVKMQQQGVAGERIRIAEQTLKIRSQEIRVFVR